MSGGRLLLNVAINALNWTRTITLTGNAEIATANGTSTIDENIVLGGNTLTITGSVNLTISGVISGTGGLTCNMSTISIVLILSGTNTYTGMTYVNEGTTKVNGEVDSTTGDCMIAVGGSLAGTGIVKCSTDVLTGGEIHPGGSVGTLTVNGNVTFMGASKLVVDVTNPTKDLLAIGGNLVLPVGTALIELEAGYSGNSGSSYQIVTVVGTFDNTGGKIFSAANLPGNWTVTYTANTDIKLNFTGVIPTMSEWGMIIMLLSLATAAFIFIRKQRTRSIA